VRYRSFIAGSCASFGASLVRAALALAGCALACGGTAEGPPHILLVSVDTLRADHTSLYGYARDTTPRLREHFHESRGGRVYERAYAAEANTAPSVVSLLSGRLPQEHGVRLLYQQAPDGLETLPDWLGAAGYVTAGVVSNVVLTEEALGIADRFDHYDDFVDEPGSGRGVYERVASRTTDAALAWLAGREPDDGPTFLWVHYIDPHGPYTPPADAPKDFRHEGFAPIDRTKTVDWASRAGGATRDALEWVDRYDEEIAYADREVGRLLDAHRELGFGDHAIAVFTSDHGETLAESERWFHHGHHVLEPLLRVPLALRGPGIPAGRVREPVSLVDVAPTLLAAAGVEPPESLAGRSLLEPAPGWVFSEASSSPTRQWRTAIGDDEKWVVLLNAKGHALERYGVDPAREDDPRARRAWRGDATGAAALERLIADDPDPGGVPHALRAGRRPDAPKVAPRADPAAIEKLRALGYVESAPVEP